jgi:endoglucanase
MSRHAVPAPGRWALPAAGLALALVIAAIVVLTRRGTASPVMLAPATTQSGVPGPGAGGRWSGRPLYVDPSGAAVNQIAALQDAGRTADVAALRRIADQPAATWFTDEAPGYAQRARQLAAAATAAGRLPVLALSHIPERDCAGASAGGADDADAYRAWIRNLARALRGHRALVVLEPGAVPQAVLGCRDGAAAAERYDLLAEAVDALRANPRVRVYLDAGNPTWITEPLRMTAALRRSGIGRAAGFSLNVAGFETTAANVAYGTRLSALLGGPHFVVDTSRNGNGPAPRGAGDRHVCNPPGRRLGEVPTTRTGVPLADAYLWVKRPGQSDGACGDGAPPAGQWWPEYALSLARPPT